MEGVVPFGVCQTLQLSPLRHFHLQSVTLLDSYTLFLPTSFWNPPSAYVTLSHSYHWHLCYDQCTLQRGQGLDVHVVYTDLWPIDRHCENLALPSTSTPDLSIVHCHTQLPPTWAHPDTWGDSVQGMHYTRVICCMKNYRNATSWKNKILLGNARWSKTYEM